MLQCARASDAPDPGLCASAQPDCSVVYRFRYDEATPLLGTPNFGLGRLTTAEGPQLFYAVTIPATNRATLTLTPTSATPRAISARVLDTCASTTCATSIASSSSANTPVTMTVDATATGPRSVIVAVSAADVTVTDATFDLSVAFTAPPYVITTLTAACDDMTGATALTYLSATSDDTATAMQTLPFSVRFFNATATNYTVASNGFVQLFTSSTGTGATSFSNAALASSTVNGMVAPFWDDLAFGTAPAATLTVQTFGTAPTRRFVVQHADYTPYSVTTARLTFQTKFFEGTNVIETHYCAMTNSSTGTRHTGDSATVGLRSIDGTLTAQAAYNTAGTTAGGTAYRFTPGM